jgi:hypothetical protein
MDDIKRAADLMTAIISLIGSIISLFVVIKSSRK